MDFLFRYTINFMFLFFFLSAIYANEPATPIVCDQEYALCTSARCIPTPGSSTKAICDCVVNKGKSVGYKTCQQRLPRQDKYKVTSLISTFSFAQFATKTPMNCPEGSPWTNCVDMPCTVDPQNPKHALCNCKINDTQAFFTFGGDCNTNTCSTGFWSGATETTGVILRNALIKKMNPKPNTSPEACISKKSHSN